MSSVDEAIVAYLEVSLCDNSQPVPDCKFIVLKHEGTPMMVFGAYREFPYHAALLERFTSEQDIMTYWERKPDTLELVDPDWELAGGGWLRIDRSGRKAQVFGHSTAYGAYSERDTAALAGPFLAAIGCVLVSD